MSAYIVSESVIKTIVVNYNLALFERGIIKKISLRTATEQANLLMSENVRSVNYRYDDKNEVEKITFNLSDAVEFHADQLAVLESVSCLEYQSCETEDYRETEAALLLVKIENFVKFGCDPAIYHNKVEVLHVGQKVRCGLYGGNVGYIQNIEGEQSPETCEVSGGVIHRGGGANFDIVWENLTESKRTPECIVRGVQWDILAEVVSLEAVCNLLAQTHIKAATDKIKADNEAARYAEAVAAMPAQHPHLIPDTDHGGAVLVAKNIRIELKKAFPGVKFSVRKEDYHCVYVRWTDGPAVECVDDIINRYQAGRFDGMTDSYNYSNTPFSAAFGSVQYVSSSREVSDSAIKSAINLMYVKFKANFIRDDLGCPTVEQYRRGELMNMQLSGYHSGGDDVQSEVYTFLRGLSC